MSEKEFWTKFFRAEILLRTKNLAAAEAEAAGDDDLARFVYRDFEADEDAMRKVQSDAMVMMGQHCSSCVAHDAISEVAGDDDFARSGWSGFGADGVQYGARTMMLYCSYSTVTSRLTRMQCRRLLHSGTIPFPCISHGAFWSDLFCSTASR